MLANSGSRLALAAALGLLLTACVLDPKGEIPGGTSRGSPTVGAGGSTVTGAPTGGFTPGNGGSNAGGSGGSGGAGVANGGNGGAAGGSDSGGATLDLDAAIPFEPDSGLIVPDGAVPRSDLADAGAP